MKDAPPPDPVPAVSTAPVPFPVLRSAGIMAAVVSTLTWGVYSVLNSMGYPLQANLNALAAAVCCVSGLIGLWPVWSMSRRAETTGPMAGGVQGAAMGFMAGILLRMLVCGAVVIAAQYSGYDHAGALTGWIAGWYMVVLAVEVKLVSSFALTQTAPPAAGNAGDRT